LFYRTALFYADFPRALQLCDYIFELAQRFNAFYENCPVLQAPSPEARTCRAQLCALTAGQLCGGYRLA
jgi:arginyl-tRNA synthetase